MPFEEPVDRGWKRERVTFTLAPDEELLFETLPGPDGAGYRDWCAWGPVVLR